MFDLVIDVEHYPAFLPWCSHGEVLSREQGGMTAEVGIDFRACGKPSSPTATSVCRTTRFDCIWSRGRFRAWKGGGFFTPVGQGGTARLPGRPWKLNYGFSSAVLAKVVGPVFDRIASSLMDAFVKRAEQVYGAAAA